MLDGFLSYAAHIQRISGLGTEVTEGSVISRGRIQTTLYFLGEHSLSLK